MSEIMGITQADVALVHGSGVTEQGGVTVASETSRACARSAADLYKAGIVGHLIVSGHGPMMDSGQTRTEAELMAGVLQECGVPDEDIFREPNSYSTLGNWVKSAAIMQREGFETVIGVSRRLQEPRAQWVGKFVAGRSKQFEVVGYGRVVEGNGLKHAAIDVAREGATYLAIRRFLSTHKDTPLDQLPLAYEKFKSRIGLTAVKRRISANAY